MRIPPDRYALLPPFVLLGAACIVAGGLVAAVTAPLGLEHGSWMAAYLVLAAGVAQIALGAGQSLLAPRAPSWPVVWAEVVGWNLGGAAVIAGTLLGAPALTTAAGAVLTATLLLFIFSSRGSVGGSRPLLWSYRLVLLILIVSVPVGVLMAWQRHS